MSKIPDELAFCYDKSLLVSHFIEKVSCEQEFELSDNRQTLLHLSRDTYSRN